MEQAEINAILEKHKAWLSCPDSGARADLSRVYLSRANLRGADLHGACLRRADLRGACLREADLRWADLSGAIGILSATDWLCDNFTFDDAGNLIVYRAQGGCFAAPEGWVFETGAVLAENVNPDRGTFCGCGVHFATLEWVQEEHPDQIHWKCIVRPQWLAGIVVPFGTDGKARCERLELVEIIKD